MTRVSLILDNNNDNTYTVQELSIQETQLSEMIKELTNFNETPATLQMFLQYSPDSVTYLLDKCILLRGTQVNVKKTLE